MKKILCLVLAASVWVGFLACSNPDDKTLTLSSLSAISVGLSHTCAVASGVAKCWGKNTTGQLGNNSIVDSPTPVAPFNLPPRVMGIFAGTSHSCALIAGGVKCWGKNDVGQLGSGLPSPTPTLIPQDTGVAAGSAATRLVGGNDYTCTLVPANNSLRCWGSNASGQFGNGVVAPSVAVPTAVSLSTTSVLSLAMGYQHGCATPQGGLACWGLNANGQLGDGTYASPRTSATTVPGFAAKSDAQLVAAGADHSCAVVGGVLYCWGANDFGQLGDGTTNAHLMPTPVPGIAPNSILAISAGNHSTCIVTKGASAMCWGYNSKGQLGDGTTTNRLVPTTVVGLSGTVLSVSTAVSEHSCALTGSGFYCWGSNAGGQLGDGTLVDRATPVAVAF